MLLLIVLLMTLFVIIVSLNVSFLFEMTIFAGLGSLHKIIVALQSEVSAIPIYKNMPHLTESISCFEKAGFDLAGMYPPVVYEQSTLQVVEFDCLMVKAKI